MIAFPSYHESKFMCHWGRSPSVTLFFGRGGTLEKNSKILKIFLAAASDTVFSGDRSLRRNGFFKAEADGNFVHESGKCPAEGLSRFFLLRIVAFGLTFRMEIWGAASG